MYHNHRINRRALLAAVGGCGISGVLGDALITSPPWLDYEGQARVTWETPFRQGGDISGQMREVIRYATLAPSGHNTQPWKFDVQGLTVLILPDYARRLPAVDPHNRELWISLGCALENLTLAARYAGYEADVIYPEADADFITVYLRPTSSYGKDSLFDAIPHRQNNRSKYDGRVIPQSTLRGLEGVESDTGTFALVFTDVAHKEAIVEYIKAGDLSQFGNPAFTSELVSWIRFNKSEALHSPDGLYTGCTGNPNVPRWLGRWFLTGASAKQQSDISATKARSSSGLILIAAAKDDKHHWIETGRLYERLALKLTASGIQVAFLNQPAEVPELRSQLQSYLKLGPALPQLLLRFGYATPLPRSLRRPIEDVLT